MKQKEKNTPIPSPALFKVPANCAIMADSKQTEIMHPNNLTTIEAPWLNGCMPEQGNGGPPSEASGIILKNRYRCHDQQDQGDFQVDR